jgi:Sulfotransferase family
MIWMFFRHLFSQSFAKVRAASQTQHDARGATENADTGPVLSAQEADFRPYPIDWRFLPEPVLVVKDTLRHVMVKTVFSAAHVKWLRPIWRRAAQSRILAPAQRAQRLFIHVPKTGGTSISSCLYHRNQPHLTAEFIFDLYGDAARSLPSFAVVRHPLDRLKSAYHFLKHGGTEIIAASRYEMRQVNCACFDSFVGHLHDNPDLMRHVLTLSPQHSYVCDAQGHVIVDHVFRMTSQGFSRRLIDWLGLPQLPRLNAGDYDKSAVHPATQRKVEQLYAADYELFESRIVES